MLNCTETCLVHSLAVTPGLQTRDILWMTRWICILERLLSRGMTRLPHPRKSGLVPAEMSSPVKRQTSCCCLFLAQLECRRVLDIAPAREG